MTKNDLYLIFRALVIEYGQDKAENLFEKLLQTDIKLLAGE